jgi:hypothetical protein
VATEKVSQIVGVMRRAASMSGSDAITEQQASGRPSDSVCAHSSSVARACVLRVWKYIPNHDINATNAS